jgi:protein involved in polysaccharide export with SLBB domain
MKHLIILCAAAGLLATPSYGQTPQAQAQHTAQLSRSYQLGPGDRVRITVFGETELTGEYDIATDGALTFPLVGEVSAMGLTPDQLSRAIATRLRRGYLREPRVVSSVISYRPFYILGEVNNPGTYPYAANLDVMSAVAIAGGYTYRANKRRVFIRRAGASHEEALSLRETVYVQPGDTVRIGERFF